MAYGELLVPVSGAEKEPEFLKKIQDFNENLKSNVTLFYCSPDPKDMLMISADGFVAGAGATLIEDLEKSNEEVWQRVQKHAAEHPDFALEHEKGNFDLLLSERAVISDLLVVSGKCASGKTNLSLAFEEALLESNIPALVLKENAPKTVENIAIAWEGSAQAARAVKAALPLLKQAKYVTIFQITGDRAVSGSIIYSPEKLQVILAKNGIKADILAQPRGGKPTSDLILSLCEKIGADTLVSGAYGHSRAREFVFGGTSRTFLKAENGPNLILSH